MRNLDARSLTVIALLIALASPASGAAIDKTGPRLQAALYKLDQGISPATLRAEGRSVSPRGELDVFIYGPVDVAQLEALGVRVRTQAGPVLTAYIPPQALPAVASLTNVTRIVGAMRAEPALDLALPETGAHLQRLAGPGFEGANGEGVILGAVDSGVDLDHPDFLDESGDTRLLKVWDQGDATGPAPIGFAYGTEWTSAQIDAGSATQTDLDGHGTSVLGCAAGDGSGTGGGVPAFTYVGMAPKADLVMVKTTYSNSALVDGIEYVFDQADALGVDAVVNLSLGNRFGPHDGTSLLEVAVDALIGPGRLVVAATQNWRGLPIHAEVFADASPGIATVEVSGSGAGTAFATDGYYDAAGTIDVSVETPGGTVVGPVSLGFSNAAYPGELTPDGYVYIFHGMSFSTVDPEVYIEVNSTGQDLDGTWDLIYDNVSMVTDGEVDMWLATGGLSAAFDVGLQSDEEMVSEPANAHNVIAVGSWTTRSGYTACNGDFFDRSDISGAVGSISAFSNPGPTRDGRVKPDVVAPGAWIGCSFSNDPGHVCPASGVMTSLLPDSMHLASAGTSLAAPLVSGAAALLMQMHGTLTPDSVRAYLHANALVDGATGAVPNDDWGYGKLFIGDIALSVPTAHVRSPRLTLSSNPSYGPTSIRFDVPGHAPVDLAVFDAQGRRVATFAAGRTGSGRVTWPAASALQTTTSGIYFVRLRSGRLSVTEKLVWLRP